jgi:hypothetical protein
VIVVTAVGKVTFQFYWRGRKDQIREVAWTRPLPWAELPRVGDSIQGLTVPHRSPPVVLEVTWDANGSVVIRLSDVVAAETVEKSTALTKRPPEASVTNPAQNPYANPDRITRCIVWLLNVVERVTVYELLYGQVFAPIRGWWERKRKKNSGDKPPVGGYAWFYVAVGLVYLSLVLAFGWGAWLLIVLLPALRLFDLVRWYADLLLDRGHHSLVSSERSLFFVFLNLIEITLIAAIWLRAGQPDGSGSSALYDSFLLVTQLDAPHGLAGLWVKLGIVAVEAAALVLLAGGVALLVAEIGEKLRVTGEWQGTRK